MTRWTGILILVAFLLGAVIASATLLWLESSGQRAISVALRLQADRALESGQIDRAIGLAHQAIAHDPDDYSPYSLLGHIYSLAGKEELALQAYGTALRNTNNQRSYFGRSESVLEYDRQHIQREIEKLRR